MTHASSLQHLITLLEADEVDWDDLEDALILFPGWLGLLRSRRYPERPMDNRILWSHVSFEYSHVSPESQKWLLEFFRPYAIITVASISISDKINLLKQADVDPLSFCIAVSNDSISVIADGAREIVVALRGGSTLLRGHQMSVDASGLVRPAVSFMDDNDKLLRPGGQDEIAPTPSKIGWIQKLLGRKNSA